MFINLIKQLNKLSYSRWYWGLGMIIGLSFMGAALYYQHVLGTRPCLLCIQVRLWVSLLVLVSLAGFLLRNNRLLNSIMHLSVVLTAIALVERSYQLLGTERGFVFGDCGFELGLPAWFAIDEWLPSVYYVETSCGYTPEIIFGITMAEVLMVFSVGLLLVSVVVFLASFCRKDCSNGGATF
ncbi:MAG: disulfide bond formation protein B [Gammaproteobacteria bacterium]|nr:disulfide bond formation protein B [Gammaproteobacteria bacterium]